MRKIKINIDDLIQVLEILRDNGTKNVMFFEHNDLPAMADADDPESIIMFQGVGTVAEDEELVH